MDHCFNSQSHVNALVADKQNHPQFLNIQDAKSYREKGLGIWDRASNDAGEVSSPFGLVTAAGNATGARRCEGLLW